MFSISLKNLNHYQTLGIGFRSTKAEIKSAYHILAKKFHPDQNAGSAEAEQKFRKVKEAYETLSDRARRVAYDKEYIASGKTAFATAPSGSSEIDDSLTRNQFILLYMGVFGLPFLVSRYRSDPEVRAPDVQRSGKLVVSVPEVSPRDEVVRAFLNPFTKKWERLDDFEDPPPPLALHQYMAKNHKGVYQKAVREGSVCLSDSEPYPVHSVPLRIVS